MTNRPAIANSWYEDYCKFIGVEGGYRFVSTVDAIKDRPLVMTREEYLKEELTNDYAYGCIEFVSLQDLKGSIEFGGHYDKLKYVAEYEYDLLVIDEAHEGVDTYKTDVAFDHIKRRNTLHLSGTPFKAIANDKFPEKRDLQLDICGRAAGQKGLERSGTTQPIREPAETQHVHVSNVRHHRERSGEGHADRW